MSANDVEISTKLRPGEWTEETLAVLIQGYRQKIADMGAKPGDIKTHIEHTSVGGVNVRVEWEREPQNH